MNFTKEKLYLKECRQIMKNLEIELNYLNTQIFNNNITDLNHIWYLRKFTILRHMSTCYSFILIVKDDLYTLSRP